MEEEIFGRPIIKDEPKPGENQVERVKRELVSIPDSYLRTYVEAKAKEFEQLRTQYETQLLWATAEIKRLGLLADRHLVTAAEHDKEAQSGGFEGYSDSGLCDADH
jgi:hypothetical protein